MPSERNEMKKVISAIAVLLACSVILLVVARNIIVKTAVTKGIKSLTGVDVEIRKIDIGLFRPTVEITSLKVYNPEGFTDKLMADIPLVYVDYDLWGFLKNRAHFNKIKIEINELSVILNQQGKLNFDSFAMLMPESGGGKPPDVSIDELYLKIAKVGYKGYFPVAGTKQMDFDPGIDETFNNVTDPSKVAGDVLKKILSRIGISNFAKFDISGQTAGVKGAVTGAIDKAKEGFKNLFSR